MALSFNPLALTIRGTMKKMKFSNLILIGASCLALTACETTGANTASSSNDRTAQIDSVLERMAGTASGNGHTEQSLAILENRYRRNSNDEGLAIEYARALREMQYLNRASMVAAPFARREDSSNAAKNEFAAIQLALGNYTVAEDFSKQVIRSDPQNHTAFQHLGIALDAQGMHEEGERAYRKALEYWDGDPTAIMNNLALNLATQGYVDEAVEILQKAKSISPHRMDVERNLRIVTTLQEGTPQRTRRTPADPGDINIIPPKKPLQS